MKVLITGGAGFIGSNVAKACLEKGDRVVIWDNLSRTGTDKNLHWLREQGSFEFVKVDVRNRKKILSEFRAARRFDAILHFAAQVAVTTSVADPLSDFDTNALGTLNLLEGVRQTSPEAIFLYTSTNKVYGDLSKIPLLEKEERYAFEFLTEGISEEQPLDFHSPYGCSKGSADQYVRDYGRIYGLRTVVFRQSCIYGPRQFGVEDQGWVAWLMIARELGLPLTVYGNGKQVRDLLHIDDLSRAIFQALERMDRIQGEVFNIGGGPNQTLSVLELVHQLKKESGGTSWKITFSERRPGDQSIYVSNLRKAQELLDWSPSIGMEEGLVALHRWVQNHRKILKKLHSLPAPKRFGLPAPMSS